MARPRTHDHGTTASERRKLSEAARIAAGARRLTILLSSEAVQTLALLRARYNLPNDTATIERALIEATRWTDAEHAAPHLVW